MRPGSQGMFAPRHSLAACAIALAGLTAAGCRDINVPDPARAPHGALAAKAGIPKPLPLNVFPAALNSHLVWLTVLGLINSAIAAYYYLKLLVAAYMHEPGAATVELAPPSKGFRVAMWASALGTLFLGIFPNTLLSFVSYSATALR